MQEQTLILHDWEWEQGAKECIQVLKAQAKKCGWSHIEIWASYEPGLVRVYYTMEPKGRPDALYRGRT